MDNYREYVSGYSRAGEYMNIKRSFDNVPKTSANSS